MGTEPDVGKLRAFYAGFQCHGVVALIEYLNTTEGEGAMCLSGSTADLHEVAIQRFLPKEARRPPESLPLAFVEIGSKDGSVTPLQALEGLMQRFEEVTPDWRKQFDEICSDLAIVHGGHGEEVPLDDL